MNGCGEREEKPQKLKLYSSVPCVHELRNSGSIPNRKLGNISIEDCLIFPVCISFILEGGNEK